MKKCKCGKEIEENDVSKYIAYDLQKANKEISFCCFECMEKWIKMKQITMWGTLLLGILLFIGFLKDDIVISVFCLFLPYMIRQVAHSLKDIFSSGTVGEIVSFAVVAIGTLTVIYPAYKFIQEFLQYRNLLNR